MSGRLVLWALELTQFDIKYKARTTIKAQALADFIMEFSIIPSPDKLANPDPDQTNPEWPEDSKVGSFTRMEPQISLGAELGSS